MESAGQFQILGPGLASIGPMHLVVDVAMSRLPVATRPNAVAVASDDSTPGSGGDDPGPPAVPAFQESVQQHLEVVKRFAKLRKTANYTHPVCGSLDAHGWHAFFGMHLSLHRAQMEVIRKSLLK